MAVKTYEIDTIGTVYVSKRSGSRSLRISISAAGEVRVSIPSWAPYISGVEFAKSKSEWIQSNRPAETNSFKHGQRIGKAHCYSFISAAIDAPSSRLVGSEIRISRPTGMAFSHPEVQKAAHKGGIRALRQQSESLLPQRLALLASQHNFAYNSVTIRHLKGRWGSCDSKQNIVLNLFLMQLPWQLIDYVLLHELTHTKHLNHGSDFWDEFLKHEPRAKDLRKLTRLYKPILTAT